MSAFHFNPISGEPMRPSPQEERAEYQMRRAWRQAGFRHDCWRSSLEDTTAPCEKCGNPVRGALPGYRAQHWRCRDGGLPHGARNT